MEITEVRVKLVESRREKLKAFCSITIENCFVIRDLKIIEGSKGLFVAMPSRKLTIRCNRCGSKNQVRSNYCSDCGHAVPPDRGARGRDGRVKFHADIAHPINTQCREEIQVRVLASYAEECEAASQPGYMAPSLDDYEGIDASSEDDSTGIKDGELEFGTSHREGRAVPEAGDARRLEHAGESRETSQGARQSAALGERRPAREARAPEPVPELQRGREEQRTLRDPNPSRDARRSRPGVETPSDSPPDDNFGAGLF